MRIRALLVTIFLTVLGYGTLAYSQDTDDSAATEIAAEETATEEAASELSTTQQAPALDLDCLDEQAIRDAVDAKDNVESGFTVFKHCLTRVEEMLNKLESPEQKFDTTVAGLKINVIALERLRKELQPGGRIDISLSRTERVLEEQEIAINDAEADDPTFAKVEREKLEKQKADLEARRNIFEGIEQEIREELSGLRRKIPKAAINATSDSIEELLEVLTTAATVAKSILTKAKDSEKEIGTSTN